MWDGFEIRLTLTQCYHLRAVVICEKLNQQIVWRVHIACVLFVEGSQPISSTTLLLQAIRSKAKSCSALMANIVYRIESNPYLIGIACSNFWVPLKYDRIWSRWLNCHPMISISKMYGQKRNGQTSPWLGKIHGDLFGLNKACIMLQFDWACCCCRLVINNASGFSRF